MDEAEVISRARRGDADAVRELYRRHAGRVFATVRRLAGEDALAEDWSQEAWIRALRALPKFRGDARFSTWLHRIAVNTALHGRRWRDRRAGRETALPPNVSRMRSADRPDRAITRLTVEDALDRLPPGMRRVLVLHDVEGYTHEEIGETLGVSSGTSKSQLFKARAKMRKLLSPEREVPNGEEIYAASDA
jgi:RNA polymerase sigma-70 factor (ECF subfamily)